MPMLRDLARRYLSRAVIAALAGEAALAVLDAILGRSLLDSSFLLPVLALAIVTDGERTAVVAGIATALALLAGVWHGYLFHSAHLYRLAIVAGGGALAVLGATFRCRATIAGEQIAMLARIGEIADGSGDLEVALARLAEVLVPGAADLCELVVLEHHTARRVVSRLAGATGDDDEQSLTRPVMVAQTTLEPAWVGSGVLVRDIRRDTAISPEEQAR